MSAFAVDYVEAKPCLGCNRWLSIVLFPFGRPRADGTRHRYRFCETCVAKRSRNGVDKAERRAVNRYASRVSRLRRRQQTGRWTW